mgnify:CR=1 FL=1
MPKPSNPSIATCPSGASAALVLADGTIMRGIGLGATGISTGEICFNTSMTGYQEVITDPSYAGQIITFTFPHVGNVGANEEDIESPYIAARGLVLRTAITKPSNYRSTCNLNEWLKKQGLIGISGIDTRRLTQSIRDNGFQTATLCHLPDSTIDIASLLDSARSWPGLDGMDLAAEVTCSQSYNWKETQWTFKGGYGQNDTSRFLVVAIDYGIKRNILRCLASAGCEIIVVPATTGAEDILSLNPDGIFLSNGPGDPSATGSYAIPIVQQLVESGCPIFGICLGHQILALALGANSRKMECGHRGANHPVKDLETGRVEITSQNHGFVIDSSTLPHGVTPTHTSLFDGSLEGLRVDDKPIFSVQYHPEASPGPRDSHYLFNRFIKLMELS